MINSKPVKPARNPAYWKLALKVIIYDLAMFVMGADGLPSQITTATFQKTNALNKPRTFSPFAVKGNLLLVNISF